MPKRTEPKRGIYIKNVVIVEFHDYTPNYKDLYIFFLGMGKEIKSDEPSVDCPMSQYSVELSLEEANRFCIWQEIWF